MQGKQPHGSLACLSIIVLLTLPPPLSAKALTYLYINASEGNASGGHTALRFDTETYHFQHFSGGIIRLVKHASRDFDYQYRYLENRTLHQASIELNDQDYVQLRQYFNLRFLQQKQQDAILKEINTNLALLRQQVHSPLLSIQGAGLFAIHPAVDASKLSNKQTIQEYITQKQGHDFLDIRIAQLKKEIKELRPVDWKQSSLQFSEDTFLSIPYSFASRYIDTMSKLLFLQLLKNNTGLQKGLYFSPKHPLFTLSKAEISQLKIFQKQLRHDLLNLLNSQRPDWGTSAFILYARLLSLSHSIRSGKLTFLDSYAANSTIAAYAEVKRYRPLFLAQKQQALTKIIQEKKQLFAEQQKISEPRYSRFEMLSNYYYERERGLDNKQDIRVSGTQRLPSKSIPLPTHLLTTITPAQSNQYLSKLESYKKRVTQQLHELYRYDLLTRNCVTEIFDTIRKANISNDQIKKLAWLSEDNVLAFIPFGSYQSLSSDFQRQTQLSYRHLQLEYMYQQENNMLVYLREFNTLSTSHYKFNDKDALFLFFTDDKVWPRPLYGSLNLLTAATVGLYGSFSFPFDSGKTLKNAAMGLLMSLPELVFFNIRKGSYKHLKTL